MTNHQVVKLLCVAILSATPFVICESIPTLSAQDSQRQPNTTTDVPAKAASADTAPPTDAHKRLQQELKRLRTEQNIPALWAGKFHADGRHVLAVSGVRKWKNDTPAESADSIHIGSCTKAMTGVMVAQLCSAGSLSFESQLSEIFPDVEGLADSDWGHVTVQELLQHRSGAPANALWHKLHADHRNDARAARREMLNWLIKQRRPNQPKFVYSNVGFALLGHIVEAIDNEPWEALIEKKIFRPLNIKSAGFGPVGKVPAADTPSAENSKVVDAWGHIARPGLGDLLGGLFGKTQAPTYQPVQIDNPPPLGPAGRVHLSVADWSKFVLLFASDEGPKQVGVKPEVWSQLLQANEGGNYAGGWVLLEREWAGGRTLFHNGSNTSWYCVAFVAPGKHYCLLAATNTFSDAANKACDQAVTAAIALEF